MKIWLVATVVLLTSATALQVQLVAAVLPSSQSVPVGTATAFPTIVNAETTDTLGCSIAPRASVAASLIYQTTDPATNLPTRAPNTPVNIPAGGSQSFVIVPDAHRVELGIDPFTAFPYFGFGYHGRDKYGPEMTLV